MVFGRRESLSTISLWSRASVSDLRFPFEITEVGHHTPGLRIFAETFSTGGDDDFPSVTVDVCALSVVILEKMSRIETFVCCDFVHILNLKIKRRPLRDACRNIIGSRRAAAGAAEIIRKVRVLFCDRMVPNELSEIFCMYPVIHHISRRGRCQTLLGPGTVILRRRHGFNVPPVYAAEKVKCAGQREYLGKWERNPDTGDIQEP